MDHLERAKLNPVIVVSLISPEDGNISSFRNVVLSSYSEFQTMDEDQKPCDLMKWTNERHFILINILVFQHVSNAG
jgi:hypothetical protein